jgi:hypothetical protein
MYKKVLITVFITWPFLVFAQAGQRRATDLFPHDYVKQRGSDNKVGEIKYDLSDSSGADSKGQEVKVSGDKKEKNLVPSVSDNELIGDESNVVSVHSIGLIINGDDKEHVERNLDSLNLFNINTNVPVSKIYFIAHPNKILDVFSRLYKLGFSLNEQERHESALIMLNQHYMPNLPEQFSHIEYSPTWILDTEFGLIFLEGAKQEIRKYFNEKGQFKLGRIKLTRE